KRARWPDAPWKGADDANGLWRGGDARSNRPLADGDFVRRPSDRFEAAGLDLDEGDVFLFIHANHHGGDFLLIRQPAGQFAGLELAGLGESQTVGVNDGPEGDGFAVNIEFDD